MVFARGACVLSPSSRFGLLQLRGQQLLPVQRAGRPIPPRADVPRRLPLVPGVDAHYQLHPSRILVDCVRPCRPCRVRAGRAKRRLRRPSPDRLLCVCAARTHRRLAHVVWESRPPLRHLFARCVGSHVGFLPSLASHTGMLVVWHSSQATASLFLLIFLDLLGERLGDDPARIHFFDA